MKKYLFLFWLSILIPACLTSQDLPKRQIEALDRGIVAVRTGHDSVLISWRLLATDPENIGFNLYRNKEKLNKKPLKGATNFLDRSVSNSSYSVKAVIGRKEVEAYNTCFVWN